MSVLPNSGHMRTAERVYVEEILPPKTRLKCALYRQAFASIGSSDYFSDISHSSFEVIGV
jgi:hypothetical protein